MRNLNKAEISIDVVQWLNKKTASSNHKIILLEGFSYMLIKLKRQGSARVNEDGLFHQRFWRSLDSALNYNLHSTNKKRMPAGLYEFYFNISLQAEYIEINGDTARITNKGLKFLQKSYHDQLDFLLSKIW